MVELNWNTTRCRYRPSTTSYSTKHSRRSFTGPISASIPHIITKINTSLVAAYLKTTNNHHRRIYTRTDNNLINVYSTLRRCYPRLRWHQ